MEEPSFSISFPLDFWTRYHASVTLIHRLWSTWFAYAFFVGVPTLAFIAAFLFGWNLARPGAFDLPGWALLLGGYVFMFIFVPLLQILQLWLASRRNRTLLGIQHQALTGEGFSASANSFTTSLKWDAIFKAVETKHFFLFYISSRGAYFIPKARISAASELDRLRDVLRFYLHDKAQIRLNVSTL